MCSGRYRYSHASRPNPNRRKAQKRTSQSRINSWASLLTSFGTGGLTSFALDWSLIFFGLQQIVKVKEEAECHCGEQRKQHKPAPGPSRCFWVKRVGGFQYGVAHRFADSNVRSIPEILAKRVVNLSVSISFVHGSPFQVLIHSLAHQKGSDLRLLTFVQSIPGVIRVGKPQAQNPRVWA